MVIEARHREQIDHTAMNTGFVIACTIDNPCQPGMQNRAGAHGARLKRHKQFAPGQAVVFEITPGIAQRGDFGVCGRVTLADR